MGSQYVELPARALAEFWRCVKAMGPEWVGLFLLMLWIDGVGLLCWPKRGK